jgi:hypothetical protein
MLTLAGLLVIVMGAAVVAAVGLFCWVRYKVLVHAEQHADELIAANRATPRPGMAAPDLRFHVVTGRRRDRGPYAS